MVKIIRSPRINVVVTPEIIASATQEDSNHCMIAEALKAAVPAARRVSVDVQSIAYSIPGMGVRYTFFTPRIGQEALVAFDNREEVEPFTMQLRNPQITPMSNRRAAERRKAEREAAGLTEREQEIREAKRELVAKARERVVRGDGTTKAGKPRQRAEGRTMVPDGNAAGPAGGGKGTFRIEGGRRPPAASLYSGGGRVPPGRRRSHGIRAFERKSAKLLPGDQGE